VKYAGGTRRRDAYLCGSTPHSSFCGEHVRPLAQRIGGHAERYVEHF
jgi:hypothetical protein